LSSLRRKNSTAQVHLRGHPASENVAIRICVLGHCDRLNHQFAFWSIGHVVPHNSITVDATIFLFLPLCVLTEKIQRKRNRKITRSACNRRNCRNDTGHGQPPRTL